MAIETFSDSQCDQELLLARLSMKEREVLDHILQHKSLKVIAHDLGITLSAVDQRLKSARVKLAASDRNEAARKYSAILETCRKSTYGFEAVGTEQDWPVVETLEPPSRSAFMLKDSATFIVPQNWHEQGQGAAVSEVLDEKFGRLWRICAIPVFAVAIAVLALALIAMAQSLGQLL